MEECACSGLLSVSIAQSIDASHRNVAALHHGDVVECEVLFDFRLLLMVWLGVVGLRCVLAAAFVHIIESAVGARESGRLVLLFDLIERTRQILAIHRITAPFASVHLWRLWMLLRSVR